MQKMNNGEAFIELRGITKIYPGGVVANDNIDLTIRRGEIHGILGENGAGKTTLMRILVGEIRPDKGEILLDGEKVTIKSPQTARHLSIGMVHQQRKLIPKFNAVENILLGDPRTGTFPNIERAKQSIRELARQYDFKVDLDAKLWQLDAGEAQVVEILKVLYSGARIIIMDEPTAGLSPMQQEKLLSSLIKMAKDSRTVIPFVTHKMPVVSQVCDRVTVLRSGKVVATTDSIKDMSKETMAELMVGKTVLFNVQKPKKKLGPVLLDVQNLSALNDQGVPALVNASFTIRKGEILGIAGVAGNGQDELAEVIYGLRRSRGGRVFLEGEDITHATVKKRRELGMAFRPDGVLERGLIGDFSILDNFILSSLYTQSFCQNTLICTEDARTMAEREFSNYAIRAPSIFTKTNTLSGGNLSKLLLAAEFSWNSKLLIDQLVTQGLDVATTEYVRSILFHAKKAGMAILLFSKDLDEIFMMCDRVAPIYEGRLGEPVPTDQTDKTTIGAAIIGNTG